MKIKYSDIIGKTVLAGFTYYNKDGSFADRRQFYGKIISADKNGITVRKTDGETFELPPDLSALEKAAAGIYTLKSTGETAADPDFLSTWSITVSE